VQVTDVRHLCVCHFGVICFHIKTYIINRDDLDVVTVILRTIRDIIMVVTKTVSDLWDERQRGVEAMSLRVERKCWLQPQARF
jgi:predicted pyridoxine 5'-phosphate oxidase superfamily flavin-nucleotide-binding protein